MCDIGSITVLTEFNYLINCIKTNTDFTFYSFKNSSYTDFLKIFKEKVYYDIFYNKLKELYGDDELLISFKIKSLLTLILLNSYKLMYSDDSIRIENIDKDSKGKLKTVSNNCYYTIIKVKGSLKFVKIVDYIFKESGFSVISNIQDNIIYDIVNGYIFNYIMSRNKRYEKYCLRYECSFLSYYRRKSDLNLYWNYSDILLYYEKFFKNNKLMTKLKDCCFVCISRYIENISLCDLFDKYIDEYKIHVELILTSEFINFFKFFSYMGFEYGFKHNDPHCGNILFDINNNNLVLIDYGRSVFSRYMNEENNVINTFLQKEMYKLNLNETDSYYKYTKDIDSYSKLVNFDSSSSNYYIKQSKTGDIKEYYYYMCIDELFKICMDFYKHFTNYLKNIDKYNEIQTLTIDSIYINHKSYTTYIDINNDFLKSYDELSKLESSHYLYQYKDTLLLLNEGIYIFVLYVVALNVEKKINLIDLINDLLEKVFNKDNYSIYQNNLKNFAYILYPEESSELSKSLGTYDENYEDDLFEDDEDDEKETGGFKKIKKIRKLKKYIYK